MRSTGIGIPVIEEPKIKGAGCKAGVKVGLGLGFNIPLLGLLFKWIGKERYWERRGWGK